MHISDLSLILTLLIIFVTAYVSGFIANRLKQPTIVGYILGGFLSGTILLRFLDLNFLELIAEVGVTLLLFTLGVEFSFRRLKKILSRVWLIALFQIIITVVFFFAVFFVWGIPLLPALFMASAASLSSTAIAVKILSEKGLMETLSGELTTGWLIIQDITVVPMMILLPSINSVFQMTDMGIVPMMSVILYSLIKTIVVLALLVILGMIIIPKSLEESAKAGSRELFLIATIGIVFIAAFSASWLGLSPALGAFIAGLLISETSQNHAVFSEIRPLRDVFVVIFFTALGLTLSLDKVLPILGILIFVVSLVIAFKALLILFLTRARGFHTKTAFLVASGLLPMSEFGFIIAKEGHKLGALTDNNYFLLTAVTFFSIIIGAPLFDAGQKLYYVYQKLLSGKFSHIFEKKNEKRALDEVEIKDHVVICGYGRVGRYVGRALEMSKIPFIVIDIDVHTINDLREKNIQTVYGDPADIDVLDYAQVDLATVVVIAIPDFHSQKMIVTNAQTLNKNIKIYCRTHFEEDQKTLKSLGVGTIVQPEFEAAVAVVNKILPGFKVSQDEIAGRIKRLKIEHGMG
ncbi:cation:proton antiporter [Patescibacteria group bacterium]